MVKIIDVGQTMHALGLYRVAKDYVIKVRVNVNPYKAQVLLNKVMRADRKLPYGPC